MKKPTVRVYRQHYEFGGWDYYVRLSIAGRSFVHVGSFMSEGAANRLASRVAKTLNVTPKLYGKPLKKPVKKTKRPHTMKVIVPWQEHARYGYSGR
jgi:hypothetical protein